jgi:hypothetical protein
VIQASQPKRVERTLPCNVDQEVCDTLVSKDALQLALANGHKSWARRWLRERRLLHKVKS